MGGSAVSAGSVEVEASVSMGGSATTVRSVEVEEAVSMGGSAVGAGSAEVVASASMGGSAVGVRSAEAAASVSMGGSAVHVADLVREVGPPHVDALLLIYHVKLAHHHPQHTQSGVHQCQLCLSGKRTQVGSFKIGLQI